MNICFSGISSEALMLATKKYCAVSNGSACTSKNYEPSYVLKAMGVPEDDIRSSIRISWGGDIDEVAFLAEFRNFLNIAMQMSS